MTAKNLDLTSDDDDPEEAEHNFKMVLKWEAESEYSSTRNKHKAISKCLSSTCLVNRHKGKS